MRRRLDEAVAWEHEVSGGTYGAPRIRHALMRAGVDVSARAVAASMRRLGPTGLNTRRAGDSRGARHDIEHVGVSHLTGVVHEDECDVGVVGELLELRDVRVIRRVHAVNRRIAHHLEGVDDDEADVGIPFQDSAQLLHQPLAQARRLGHQTQGSARGIRQAPQPALDALLRVLQGKGRARHTGARGCPRSPRRRHFLTLLDSM